MTPKELFKFSNEAFGGMLENMTEDLSDILDADVQMDDEDKELQSYVEVSTVVLMLAKVGEAYSAGDIKEADRILKVFLEDDCDA